MITAYIDPNEGNGPRLEALRQVVAEKPDRYRLEERHQALDLCISDGERQVWFELKEIDDLWASMANGHLAQQCRQASALGDPALIAVFGGLEDVLLAAPKFNGNGYKKRDGQEAAKAQMRGFDADLFASQFPIQFLSRSHTLSFKLILSRSRRWLEAMADGKLPMAGWLPKAPDFQTYAFCGIPTIGPERAKAMMEAGFHFRLVRYTPGSHRTMWFPPVTESHFEGVTGIGPKTAGRILEAVR